MKRIKKELSLLGIVIISMILCSSFTKPSRENKLLLRNIEVLTRGEENPEDPCVEATGKCIYNGLVRFGMTAKRIKK